LTRSHLEVAVEGPKLEFLVFLASYKVVARKNLLPDRKLHHVISRHRKRSGSDVIWPEVSWKWMQNAENSSFGCIWLPTRW